jgi:hypothetical protein
MQRWLHAEPRKKCNPNYTPSFEADVIRFVWYAVRIAENSADSPVGKRSVPTYGVFGDRLRFIFRSSSTGGSG